MVEYTLLAFQNMIRCTRKDKIMHSKLDFRPVQIITDHVIYNSPYKYVLTAERGDCSVRTKKLHKMKLKNILKNYLKI